MECKHCVLELYKADANKLNDEAFVRSALITAAEAAGATLISVNTHAFKPHGVTGFALLAESHISIHTWPECNFASIDAFTCGETTNPEEGCLSLVKDFNSNCYSLNFIERADPPLLNKTNVYQMQLK